MAALFRRVAAIFRTENGMRTENEEHDQQKQLIEQRRQEYEEHDQLTEQKRQEKKNEQLFDAAMYGRHNDVQHLIEQGAVAQWSNPGWNGRTPLHAARTGEIAEILVKAGANIEAIDEIGESPLHYARSAEVANVLLQSGASIDTTDKFGNNCLHSASKRGRSDVISFFISKGGMDINATNHNGVTALELLQHDAQEEKEFAGYAGIINDMRSRCLKMLKDEYNIVPQSTTKDVSSSDAQHVSTPVDHSNDPYFEKAIAEGSGEFKHVIFIMHGPPGSGKTSVQRLMLGEPPLPEEEQQSTDIMERPIRTCKIMSPNGTDRLSKMDKDRFIQILHESIIDKSNDLQSNPNADSVKEKEKLFYGRPNLPSSNPPGSSTAPLESPSTPRFSNSEILQVLKEKLPNIKSPRDLFKQLWIYLVDSGGQPQFSDVLPLLFQSESLYIVVVRLDIGLHEKYKNNYRSNGKCYELPDYLELTQYQMIERVCQIAKAQSVSSDPKQVVIIATRLDSNETKVKEFNEELMILHREYDEYVQPNDFNSGYIIFPVNAMATGNKREKHTRELQECLFSVVEEMSNHVSIPLRWFLYELDLDKASQSTHGVVKEEKCFELGHALKMNKDETKRSVKFFGKLGTHLYRDEFPNLVLVDMHPLTARLSELIKASFVYPKRQRTGPYTQLKKYGLFDMKLLQTVFKSFQDISLSKDDFIRIALCLKIIVSAKDGNFFIPSVLPVLDNQNDSTLPKDDDPPCGFYWRDAFLPPGFFFTFIVELLEQKDKKYFALRNQSDTTQYRDKITLDTSYGGILTICNEQDWICVHYSCCNRRVEDYIEILKLIKHAIELAIKYFLTTIRVKMALPEFCFLCVCCEHGHKRHRCEFNPRGDKPICTLDTKKILSLSDEMMKLSRDMQVHQSKDTKQDQKKADTITMAADPDTIRSLVSTIKEVFNSNVARLDSLLRNSMEIFALKMLQEQLIPHAVSRSRQYTTIIDSFLSSFEFITEQREIEQKCIKFLKVLRTTGGIESSEYMKNQLVDTVRKAELSIELHLDH